MNKSVEYSIKFEHSNGEIVTMHAAINPLNGAVMRWSDYDGCWVTDRRALKSLVRNIRAKCKVLSDSFDFVK